MFPSVNSALKQTKQQQQNKLRAGSIYSSCRKKRLILLTLMFLSVYLHSLPVWEEVLKVQRNLYTLTEGGISFDLICALSERTP